MTGKNTRWLVKIELCDLGVGRVWDEDIGRAGEGPKDRPFPV